VTTTDLVETYVDYESRIARWRQPHARRASRAGHVRVWVSECDATRKALPVMLQADQPAGVEPRARCAVGVGTNQRPQKRSGSVHPGGLRCRSSLWSFTADLSLGESGELQTDDKPLWARRPARGMRTRPVKAYLGTSQPSSQTSDARTPT
jgi:hypothetical protein